MSLSILNVGAGDTKLTFDKDKPVERERAAKIVTDMLRRGYALLVQVGEKNGRPLYQSAAGFDPQTCEYLIVGLPEEEEQEIAETLGARPSKKLSKKKSRRLDAAKTPAVAVARHAGG